MRIAPVRSVPNCRLATVSTGGQALRIAWVKSTDRSDSPLARWCARSPGWRFQHGEAGSAHEDGQWHDAECQGRQHQVAQRVDEARQIAA